MSVVTKQRDLRIAAQNAKIRSMPEIYVIHSGNGGPFPYYKGDYSPLSVAWESARLFPTMQDAIEHLAAFGCPGTGQARIVRVK